MYTSFFLLLGARYFADQINKLFNSKKTLFYSKHWLNQGESTNRNSTSEFLTEKPYLINSPMTLEDPQSSQERQYYKNNVQLTKEIFISFNKTVASMLLGLIFKICRKIHERSKKGYSCPIKYSTSESRW